MSVTAYPNHCEANFQTICKEQSISRAAGPLEDDKTVALTEESNIKLLSEDYPSTPGSSNYDLSYYFDQSVSSNAATTSFDQVPTVNYKRGRSLSIGSTVSVSHQQLMQPQTFVLPNDESKSQIYKKKNDKSNRKAFQFFGEQVKLEISAKEIKREGLRALLLSTVPLSYFLYHLLSEYSSENLFFYLAVDNYEHYDFSSQNERYQVAHKIFKTYLTRNSDVEVNLEDRIYRQVTSALESQHTTTGKEFDAAKKHVFSLLNVSYHQFRTSSVWDIMESKCSDLKAYNRNRAQALVANLLLSQIKRRNRDSTTFKLVHSFCRIYLPFGYEHRPEEPPISSRSNIANRRSRSKSMGNTDNKKSNGFIASKFELLKLSLK